jgi:general secretion pathway protein J
MKRRVLGFTLLELLVAMAIFAVLAVMAYGGLNSVIRQRERNDVAMLRLKQLQQTMAIMTRDFAQLAPRPVRDQLGGLHCALSAGPDNVPPIEFTRGGWTNPLGVIRSTQQRVAYALEDGTLVRYTWPELDRAVQTQPQKQMLLPEVSSIAVQYLDASGAFQDQWPPINTRLTPEQLPHAVTLKLVLKDWGEMSRIVEVAAP